MLYQVLEERSAIASTNHARQILVVDDCMDNLHIIDHMLQHTEYGIYLADSGVEAQKMIDCEVFNFDCFLVDLMMPHVNGLDVIETIRNVPRYRHAPIIIQTANRNPDTFNQLADYNIYYYLKKPYNKQMVNTILAGAINYKAKQDNLQHQLSHIARTLGRFRQFEAVITELPEVQHLADMAACCFPKPEKVVNGIIELLMNAIEHGALGISYEMKRKKIRARQWKPFLDERIAATEATERQVRLQYAKTTRGYEVSIEDPGEGFDAAYYLRRAEQLSLDPNGRGIWIAKTLCFDELQYNPVGNIVTARSLGHG